MRFNIDHLSIGIFFIGLACVFLMDDFYLFPGILLIIGIAKIPKFFFKADKLKHFQSILWLCGIPLIMMFKIIWPGVLILSGISIILDGFKPFIGQRDTQKSSKREYVTYD